MKYDIILAGVGGQGVLSLAAIIAKASMGSGLNVRQSEVHGMSQRGGAVISHLRISDSEIPGDLVPKGGADMVLAMEPMESLRYLDYLKKDGIVITAKEPVINIPNYPELETILEKISALPSSKIVESQNLAKEAGAVRAANMVLIGAAAEKLPLSEESMLQAISDIFLRKGQNIVDINCKAYKLGEEIK